MPCTPEITTLCYIEDGDKYLMLHRDASETDINRGKWLGIGGHFEAGESPEECVRREVMEETGLTLSALTFRGVITFSVPDDDIWEQIHLFTARARAGVCPACDEGTLAWVEKTRLAELPLWEGDRLFLRLLADGAPFFSLKLVYRGDTLTGAVLDGTPIPLNDGE